MDQYSDRGITLRTLSVDDSAEVQRLVRECPPLALHTPYTYWVMLSRFRRMCVGAFTEATPVGIALAISTAGGSAFVWQVGVHPRFRGYRLGIELLGQVWAAAQQEGLDVIEATIGETNDASRKTFESFATQNGLTFRATGEMTSTDASGAVADREIEYRLEPNGE